MKLFALMFLFMAVSPEPEKAWLRWANFTPRNGTEEKAPANEQQGKTQEFSSPSPNKQKQPCTSAATDQSNTKSSSVWEKAFAPEQWSQWALCIIGLGATIAAGWTLSLLKRQVDADIVSANAAKLSADISKRSLEIVERAVIVIDELEFVGLDKTDVSKFSYTFTIMNTGRTHAEIVSDVKACLITDEPLPVEPAYADSSPIEAPYNIGAGRKVEDWIEPRDKPTKTGMSIYALGCINYKDVFGNSHTTKWAIKYLEGIPGGGEFVTKLGYNVIT